MKKIRVFFASFIFLLGLLGTPYESYADEDAEALTDPYDGPVDKPWWEDVWDWIFE